MWWERWSGLRPGWESWLSELMWINPDAAAAFCALNAQAAGEPPGETEAATRPLLRSLRVA